MIGVGDVDLILQKNFYFQIFLFNQHQNVSYTVVLL